MPPISKIVIFGLRCSGTNYLSELISTNYSNVTVSEGTLGLWKHMWQAEKMITKQRILQLAAEPTVYLFVSRNVVEWLQSFNEQPHHCQWATGLSLHQLINTSPFVSYEGRRKLEAYSSILEERNRKLKHIVVEMVPHLPNSALLQYEQLRQDPSGIVGVLAQFGIHPDGPIRSVKYYKKETNVAYQPKVYKPVDSATLSIIIEKTDWEVEKYWNYEKAGLLNLYCK